MRQMLPASLNRLECLLKICDDIIDMFGADGQADGVWPDALIQQFFRRVLRVRGGCRMDNQRFDIGHIGQQREKFQMINPIPGVTLVSLQIESEDRSAVVRIILLIQLLLFRIPGNFLPVAPREDSVFQAPAGKSMRESGTG